MKKFNPIIFAFILSCALFSCSSKNMGFFNTTNPKQAVKENTENEFSPTHMTAGGTHTTIAGPSKESSHAKISKEEATETKELNTKVTPVINQKNAWSTPVKLSKEEKTKIKSSIKEILKQHKKSETGLSKGVLVIIAILLPPLAVALVDGITLPFWLSILLTLLFYVPGLIYALYRIFKTR